jgi:molybdate transport system ATP-binding protein
MIELDIRKKLRAPHSDFMLQVQFAVEGGELASLFGASGAGKTTLLRCIAGLEAPDEGFIRVGDAIWFDSGKGINLPIQRRRAGFMFQGYALFPNMSVRGNLEFAQKKGARARVDEMLELMKLTELQHRNPDTLSGGEQQRVALARTLISEPCLLLLDEPFAALDHETKSRLQDELLSLQRRLNLTALMVSHSVAEVYKLSRQVIVLEAGRVARTGAPAKVFGGLAAGGKFTFAGEVLNIEPADVAFAVTLLVGNQIVRVIATREEAEQLKTGSRVMLLPKAFNPIMLPV